MTWRVLAPAARAGLHEFAAALLIQPHNSQAVVWTAWAMALRDANRSGSDAIDYAARTVRWSSRTTLIPSLTFGVRRGQRKLRRQSAGSAEADLLKSKLQVFEEFGRAAEI